MGERGRIYLLAQLLNKSVPFFPHGAFGLELPASFNLERTLISVTTNPEMAKFFAGTGEVYSGYVPRSWLIEQSLSGPGESEFLLKHGSDLLKPIAPTGK